MGHPRDTWADKVRVIAVFEVEFDRTKNDQALSVIAFRADEDRPQERRWRTPTGVPTAGQVDDLVGYVGLTLTQAVTTMVGIHVGLPME